MLFDPIKTAVETVPGLEGKVYHAEALKNASAPFAFWLQDEEDAEEDLKGYNELQQAAFELHFCARNLETLEPMSRAAKKAILAIQCGIASDILYERILIRQASPMITEKEVGLYRKVYRISINYQEQ